MENLIKKKRSRSSFVFCFLSNIKMQNLPMSSKWPRIFAMVNRVTVHSIVDQIEIRAVMNIYPRTISILYNVTVVMT